MRIRMLSLERLERLAHDLASVHIARPLEQHRSHLRGAAQSLLLSFSLAIHRDTSCFELLDESGRQLELIAAAHLELLEGGEAAEEALRQ